MYRETNAQSHRRASQQDGTRAEEEAASSLGEQSASPHWIRFCMALKKAEIAGRAKQGFPSEVVRSGEWT